jgi:ABC-type Fe3+-hydroxamate transport system substrate-binding protein
VNDLESALEMITQVGKITGADSTELIQEITSAFDRLVRIHWPKKALYLIWKKPYMAAGSDTFIDDMLSRCGFENVVSEQRYPELTEAEIVELNPDVVFLSSEPFPFGPTHIRDLAGILPAANLKLVDGEMFSWYGSRLRLASKYIAHLIEQYAQ